MEKQMKLTKFLQTNRREDHQSYKITKKEVKQMMKQKSNKIHWRNLNKKMKNERKLLK